MEIRDYGPIRSMQLPPDFAELPTSNDPMRAVRTRRFQSSNEPGLQFQIISQLQRLPADLADVFRGHLQAAPSKAPETVLTELMPILGQLPDKNVFSCANIQPVKLQTCDGLWVEGSWLQPPLAVCSVFVDIDGSGTMVQQFVWLAPPDSPQTQMFNTILETIRWTA